MNHNLALSPSDFAIMEEVLARAGYAVVTQAIGALADKILADPSRASAADIATVLYAIHSCPWPAQRSVMA